MEKAKRFLLFQYDGSDYRAISEEQIDTTLPILFKPLGAPLPEPSYIASDADFVDYLTELMGGFAIPDFIKTYRTGKQYLLLGVSLNRDTERMLVADISYGASEPRGWVFLSDASDKEQRFCKRMQLEIIDQPLEAFTQFLANPLTDPATAMRAEESSITV